VLHMLHQPYSKLSIYLYNTAARSMRPNFSSWALNDPIGAQGTSVKFVENSDEKRQHQPLPNPRNPRQQRWAPTREYTAVNSSR